MDVAIGQVVSQLIAFLIMLWVMKRFAWKPLLGILEERRRKIQSEFDGIDAQKQEMHRLTEQYNEKLGRIEAEARAKIQEAVNEGRKISDEIQQNTQEQAKAILEKAQGDAQREIDRVRLQLKQDIVNIAVSMTEKIIGEEIDQKKHQKMISDFVDKAKF